MNNQITCPHCKQDFTIEDIVDSSLKEGFNKKYLEHKKILEEKMNTKELELIQKENKLQQVLNDKEQQLKKQLQQKETEIRTSVSNELSLALSERMKLLEEENAVKSARLKEAQTIELNMRKQQQVLEEKQAGMELEVQRKMDAQRKELEEKIRKQEQDQQYMRNQEKDSLIQEMKRQMEDMKRKMDQGSMQSQGEIQEIELEKLLASTFPFDLIEPVAKGVAGADCIQKVRNQLGKECGSIIYESKRTKNFSMLWLDKLTLDLRSAKADVAILVTEAMPKELEQFGQLNGIWVCTFAQVKALSLALRDGIIKIDEVKSAQENKGDKMHMLYNYLTGNEFSHKVKAIYDAFEQLNAGLENEKKQMLKIWAVREKQIEQVMVNTIEMYGSIKGIAGSAVNAIPELELGGHLGPATETN